MNQAERDTLTFLTAYGVVTPLLQAQKNMLLDVKLISSYCERNGRPIVDWMKISKADFNSIVLYMEEEKVTTPPSSTARCVNATKPRNSPMINFLSASTEIEDVDSLLVKQTPPKSPPYHVALVEQTPPESSPYHVAPVKWQVILHNFICYVDQGTFGIPCGGKIYCSSPGMDPVAWPQEKLAHLLRTLAHLAHQDFKKEPLIAIQVC